MEPFVPHSLGQQGGSSVLSPLSPKYCIIRTPASDQHSCRPALLCRSCLVLPHPQRFCLGVVMIDLTCQLVEILTHLGDGWLDMPEVGDYLS